MRERWAGLTYVCGTTWTGRLLAQRLLNAGSLDDTCRGILGDHYYDGAHNTHNLTAFHPMSTPSQQPRKRRDDYERPYRCAS